jgi:PAS domain S-box-containing protein
MELAATVAKIDFQSAFERLPAPFTVLDRDFVYVEANTAYLRMTQRPRDAVVGRYIFDAFPQKDEEGQRLLRESLERVRDTAREDVLSAFRYDIPAPAGGLQERYWSVTHTPILDDDGRTEFILRHTEDITELHGMRRKTADAALGQSILRRAETQAAQSAELQRLFDAAPGFMAVIRGPDLVFEWANRAYCKLLGSRELIGRRVFDAVPEAAQLYRSILERVLSTGEPFVGRGMPLTLADADGVPRNRHLDFVYQPIIGPDGEVSGVFVEGQDVTEAFQAQAKQQLLLDELNHRVKNTLASVQAIVTQTVRAGRQPQAFAQDLQARLKALSQTHDALTGSRWQGAALRAMLLTEFAPFAPQQIELSGEDVVLPPQSALPLGMVFHELATNAAKYGALSLAGGRVSVAWSLGQTPAGPALTLDWAESGGPPVAAPARQGFGARLIERTLAGELGGSASLDYQVEGLRCTLKAPLKGPLK